MRRAFMRRLVLSLGGVVFLMPGSARAQTVQNADLVGTWRGNVSVRDDSTVIDSVKNNTVVKSHRVDYVKPGIGWLVLWPDSLWWRWDSEDGQGHNWGEVSAGPWRMAGDTLYLADASGYKDSLEARIVARPDTAKPARLPSYHSTFWTLPKAKHQLLSNRISAYRIQLTNGQLSITPFDSLAKNPQASPIGVYQRSTAPPPRR